MKIIEFTIHLNPSIIPSIHEQWKFDRCALRAVHSIRISRNNIHSLFDQTMTHSREKSRFRLNCAIARNKEQRETNKPSLGQTNVPRCVASTGIVSREDRGRNKEAAMHGTMHNKHCPSASNSVPRVYIYCLYLFLAAYSPACVDTSPRTRKRASLKKEREKKGNGNTGNMRAQLSGRLALRFWRSCVYYL